MCNSCQGKPVLVMRAIPHAKSDVDLGMIICEMEGAISDNTVRKAQGERVAWW